MYSTYVTGNSKYIVYILFELFGYSLASVINLTPAPKNNLQLAPVAVTQSLLSHKKVIDSDEHWSRDLWAAYMEKLNMDAQHHQCKCTSITYPMLR